MRLCKQKEHKWENHTSKFYMGKPTGLPYSVKCSVCGCIGMLHGRKRKSKLLPISNEEFERQIEKIRNELNETKNKD